MNSSRRFERIAFVASATPEAEAARAALVKRHGEVNPEVQSHVPDLNVREWAAIIPLIVMMVWMGMYSQTFLPPVGRVNARVLEQTQVNVPFRVQSPTPMEASVAH